MSFFTGNSLATLANTLKEFSGLNIDNLNQVGTVLKDFGKNIQELLEGGSWIRGLTSNDGGLSAIATALKSFGSVDASEISRLTPVLAPFAAGAKLLGESGSFWNGIVGNDGGLAALGRGLTAFKDVNADTISRLAPVLGPFAAGAKLLGESGNFWSGLTGSDGGLASLGRGLTAFKDVNADTISRLGPVLGPFANAVKTLGEGGSILSGITGSDGGLASLGRGLESFNNVKADTISQLGPVLGPFADAVKRLGEGGSILSGLIGSDGGLASLGQGLTAFKDVDPQKIQALTPVLGPFANAIKALSDSRSALQGLFGNDGGLGAVGISLKEFSEVNVSNLNLLGGSLVEFGENVKKLLTTLNVSNLRNFNEGTFAGLALALRKFDTVGTVGVNGANFAAIGLGLKSLVEGIVSLNSVTAVKTEPLGGLAESLVPFNTINGENLKNVVSGLSQLKPVMDESFDRSNEKVNTFVQSIRDLNEQLQKLNENMRQTTVPGLGTAETSSPNTVPTITGPVNTTDRLNNSVTELVELTKLIRDNTKDTADAVRGRNRPI